MAVISGTSGNDTLFGSSDISTDGIDTLVGRDGNDILVGGSTNNNILLGGAGNDVLIGGNNGNNLLDGYGGGREFDTLIGGAGKNYFVLGTEKGVSYLGEGYATIVNFNPDKDYIVVSGSADDYNLFSRNIDGIIDTGIYYRNTDLIGEVRNNSNVSISRDFIFY